MTTLHPPQLDLFADSRDVMLRNALIDSLLQRGVNPARSAHAALAAEYPDDHLLAVAGLLIAALDSHETQSFPDPCAAGAAHDQLEALRPSVQAILGSAETRPWLAPLWSGLARRAARLPFDAKAERGHAAAFWVEAGDWPAAARAVEGIESWRRIPAPLAWMVQARWHLQGLDASWALLAELAWLAPPRFEPLVRLLPDATLKKLTHRFEIDFDPGEMPAGWAWWPAWALNEQPLLAAPMGTAEPLRQTPPERAWQLVQALLRLERQGRHHDLIEHRRRLRDLHAGLFEAYMRTR